MSFGFVAYNNNNQVLVSSDTRNLHFIGKAAYFQTNRSDDNYGGMRMATFIIDCATYPVPFFTMPVNAYTAISRIYRLNGNVWAIEIIRASTDNTIPEVYVFADPRSATASEQFGMVVYRDDGTPAFDSRLRPLAITGGLNISHPSNPRTFPGWGLGSHFCSSTDAECGPYFAPDAEYSYWLGGQPSKPMFFYPSLAQAERENIWTDSSEDCLGSNKLGICLTYSYEYWASRYWAFYRGGIRYSGGTLYAGWIVVDHGCNSYNTSSDSILSIGNIISIPTGDSSWSGGKWPYSNETLNLSAATVLVGDASRYD